ncbi:hypothetical protein D6C82_05944 [Aureobasidium pullulans]|nr:hypothetical protein D6C82_05944 [Aureobasidium pullulans]
MAHLRDTGHSYQRPSATNGASQINGDVYFTSGGSGDSESASFLFTSLAKQLATRRDTATQATSSAHIALQDALREALRQDPDVIRKSRQEQWDKLIIRPLTCFFAKLQDVSPITSAVLVIDALDECSNENDIKGIIRTMARQQLPHARLRIIITSRPETLVRLEFSDKCNILHSSLSLDDVPQHVIDADLARFLHSRFDAIRDHQEGLTEDWPGLHALNKLLRRCGGLFIYAETLCLYLEEDCQHSQSRLETVLNKTTLQGKGHTTALDDMYLTVLTNAFKNLSKLSESEKDRSKDLYDHVVGSIVVLQDDLSASTLSCLIRVSRFDIMAILHRLRSVIKQLGIESPITLLHETFREFVSDQRRCKDVHLAVDTKIAHRRTFNDCLHVLSAHLKQDLCDLKDPGIAVDDPRVDSVKLLDGLPLHVQYAVCHWTSHLERGGIDAADLCAIDTFLHKHLLHLVEAMSWLKKYAEAVESISKLYELLELGTDFKLFCWDARKFMISNGSVIARNPLQIYCSALIFSPKNSLVCQASSKERSSWLSEYRSPHEQWDKCILKIPTSRTALAVQLLIAFSPDSSKIASISDDGVEIWSVKSGISIASLAENCKTKNLLFSPDGKYLALIVDENSIWLYDTMARTLGFVLETPGHKIDKFLFSPNGLFLISISQDQVNVWTVAEAELHWTLTTDKLHCTLAELAKDSGHGPREAVHFDVRMIEISNDSSMIATVTSGVVVKLWDVETKSLHFQIPLGGFDESTTFGFSANHNLIIVQGTKVTSWDYKSNKLHMTTLSIRDPGHSQILDSNLSHWLSPDRSIVATLKDSCHVFLCNTTTGECFNRISLEGLFNWLCFSSDSTRFYLQSDYEVILHDTMSVDHADTFSVDGFVQDAALFSPDGSMLATVGVPTKIWDISYMSWQSAREKGSHISHILLSVDGTKVLYARQRSDKPTKLCMLDVLQDLPTTIESHLRVEDLSISPDNNHVFAQGADESDEHRAYLINVHDKTSLCIDSAGAAAFSSSSQLLATAGIDLRVRIWDTKSRELKTTLDGHSCAIAALEFSPSDAKLASIDVTGDTMVWDYRSSELQAVFPHQPGSGLPIHGADIAFSSDESMLACILFHNYGEAGYGYLWGLETNIPLGEFTAQHDGWRKRVLSFSDDGRYLRRSLRCPTTIDLFPFKSPCLDTEEPVIISDTWVRWQDRNVLRLPDDWCSARYDSKGNKLAMGNDKGEVALIEFDPQELRKALGI